MGKSVSERAGVMEEGQIIADLLSDEAFEGYHNRPEATAATLTEDGWLKTGDLAEVDADGFVFIRDRLKELIKVKGFQVARPRWRKRC